MKDPRDIILAPVVSEKSYGLIEHNVLRHIDLGAILRITAGPSLARYLQMSPGQTTYGRLATIFCNHRPAVDLLEIAAPLDEP